MIFGGVSPWFTCLVGSKRMAFFWAAALCLVLSRLSFHPDGSIVYLGDDSHRYPYLMGIGIYSPLMWSMYADVADYHTEHFGTSA